MFKGLCTHACIRNTDRFKIFVVQKMQWRNATVLSNVIYIWQYLGSDMPVPCHRLSDVLTVIKIRKKNVYTNVANTK